MKMSKYSSLMSVEHSAISNFVLRNSCNPVGHIPGRSLFRRRHLALKVHGQFESWEVYAMRRFAMAITMAMMLASVSGAEASNSTYSVGYRYYPQGRVIKTRLNLPNGRTLYTDYFYAAVLVQAKVMDSAWVLVLEYVYVRDSRGRLLTKVIR